MKFLIKIWFYITGSVFAFVILQAFEKVLIPLTVAFTLLPLYLAFLKKLRFNTQSKGAGKYFFISFLLVITALPVIAFLLGIGYMATDFAGDFPNLQKNIEIAYAKLIVFQEKFPVNLSIELTDFQSGFDKISRFFFSAVTSFTLNLGNFLFYVLLTLMFLFLLIIQRKSLFNALETYFEIYFQRTSRSLLQDTEKILKDFIVGLIWVRLLLLGIISFTLWLLNVPHLWFWALFGSFFSIIPYVGLIGTGILAGIYTGIFFLSLEKFLILMIIFLGFHLLEANFLTPLIVGKKVKLNAFAVFLALVLGFMVWGITGMLLSLPLLAVLRIVGKHSIYFKPVFVWISDE